MVSAADAKAQPNSWFRSNRFERIWIMSKVDFRHRYYEDKLGLLWALLNPLFRLCVYYFVFTQLFQRKQENYHLFLFLGLILWYFFGETTKKGIKVLKAKAYLLENLKFAKLDLFISATISSFLGFIFNFTAYVLIHIFTGVPFQWTLIYLPFYLLNMFIICGSIGIILAIINIYLKDINHFWDMILMAGMWTGPIFFRGKVIQEHYPFFLYINPLSGIVMNIRAVVLDGVQPDLYFTLHSIFFAIGLTIVALFLLKNFSHMAIEKG